MRKTKALVLSIICAALAVSFFTDQQFTLMWAFLAPAALFLGIWFYKYQRDRSIVAQARRERAKAAQISQPTSPMTSKGRRRLFLPPPIQSED